MGVPSGAVAPMRLPLLVLHITGGIVGLLSGTVAMVYPKGSQGHRTAGKVFVVSMLIMAACATYLAVLKHQIGNVIGGPLTFYLICTAWLAGRRGEQKPGMFDPGALVLALPSESPCGLLASCWYAARSSRSRTFRSE